MADFVLHNWWKIVCRVDKNILFKFHKDSKYRQYSVDKDNQYRAPMVLD